MSQELLFCEIGVGDESNYAGLIKSDWGQRYNLPGISSDTKWRGFLVDLQPASIIEILRQYRDEDKIHIINAAVTDSNNFDLVETRHLLEIDLETRCASASRFNDKIRPDLRGAFYCSTVTLNRLMNFIGEVRPIGLLALDTQGSEVDIFRGYDWRYEPHFIECEVHSAEGLEVIAKILRERGYDLIRNTSDGKGRVKRLWQLN